MEGGVGVVGLRHVGACRLSAMVAAYTAKYRYIVHAGFRWTIPTIEKRTLPRRGVGAECDDDVLGFKLQPCA
jgi:hypothetical protein